MKVKIQRHKMNTFVSGNLVLYSLVSIITSSTTTTTTKGEKRKGTKVRKTCINLLTWLRVKNLNYII